MQQPWVLVERDREGGLPLRDAAVAARGRERRRREPARGRRIVRAPARRPAAGRVPVTIGRTRVEEGGARVVDHGVTPPFALDMQRLAATSRASRPIPARSRHAWS